MVSFWTATLLSSLCWHSFIFFPLISYLLYFLLSYSSRPHRSLILNLLFLVNYGSIEVHYFFY